MSRPRRRDRPLPPDAGLPLPVAENLLEFVTVVGTTAEMQPGLRFLVSTVDVTHDDCALDTGDNRWNVY
jgi:hypothetical protein